MISALLYLQAHSFRNRLVHRLKRLKQPKYLIGAVVGGLYFYFYFFRFLFQGFSPGPRGAGAADHALVAESLGALALLVIVFLAWLIPHERAALTFTEAEVAFLFPAPVSRRGLVHFKLIRSQMRIAITTLLLTLLSNRLGGGNAWIQAAGWWLLLSILNLHFLGSSFARTLLLDRGITNWTRRGIVLAVAVIGVGIVASWARRSLPAFGPTDTAHVEAILAYLQRVLGAGPAPYLLFPFRLIARPVLAPDATAFVQAVGPALLIFILHYLWVIYSNVAFEEASLAASQKLASRIEAARSGGWHGSTELKKGRRPWFKLAAHGPPATALVWKNLISVGQSFSWRIWISLGVMCIAVFVSLAGNPRAKTLVEGVVALATVVLTWSLLIGPLILRQDFRQDLQVADLLKTYPLRGWQIALGEVIAPVLLLAAFQWLLILLAVGLFARVQPDAPLTFSSGVAAAVLLPFLDAILLLIPNAAVLLFPSWLQVGKESPRGIEVTGQRLVFFLGQIIVLAVGLLPAAAVFTGVFFLLRLAMETPVVLPLAAVTAAAVLAAETVVGILLLGKLFERFDLSAELSP